jgi:hypothetical protein
MNDNEKREVGKVFDTLKRAADFHARRDEMNAQTHLAETVRYAPLTSSLQASLDTLKRLLEEAG